MLKYAKTQETVLSAPASVRSSGVLLASLIKSPLNVHGAAYSAESVSELGLSPPLRALGLLQNPCSHTRPVTVTSPQWFPPTGCTSTCCGIARRTGLESAEVSFRVSWQTAASMTAKTVIAGMAQSLLNDCRIPRVMAR